MKPHKFVSFVISCEMANTKTLPAIRLKLASGHFVFLASKHPALYDIAKAIEFGISVNTLDLFERVRVLGVPLEFEWKLLRHKDREIDTLMQSVTLRGLPR